MSDLILSNNLPEKKNLERIPVNLEVQYWSPLSTGETKEVLFVAIEKDCELQSFSNPEELIKKDAVKFIELIEIVNNKGEVIEKKYQTFRCAQSRLVSLFQTLQPGGVYQIVYKGKQKNKTNNNQSDVFEVFQMMPKNE